MKKKNLKLQSLILIIGIILISCNQNSNSKNESESKFTELKGPYLGQIPPGMIPEVFAPGIISTDVNEGCLSFSKDGTLFLFTRADVGILLMKQVNGVWTQPKLAPFSAGKCDWDFMLMPDDKTVFVSSARPNEKGGETLQDYRIWISERSENNWSTPDMSSFVNTFILILLD